MNVTPSSLPYAELNVRRNPFGEFSEAERTACAVVSVDRICEQLSNPACAVQFVGDKGFGKTTHLLAIRARFAEAGYVHIPEGERAALPTGCPVLIDEAQRLTFLQRRTAFRPGIPLVLGTHRDFETQLKKAGRIVETIPVDRDTNTDRLHDLLSVRIDSVRRSADPVPWVSRKTVADLLERHGSDIRAILHDLYRRFEKLPHIDAL